MPVRLALHTLQEGADALPLVLLHAFPVDHRMWLDVVKLLPQQITVYAPDLPGLGTSPAGPDLAVALGVEPEPSVDLGADALVASLAERGVNRAVVAGLSMGGYVTLALAERAPALLAGIGLLDTKSTADTDEARANRYRVADEVTAANSAEPVMAMRTKLLAPANQADSDLVSRVAGWIGDQPPAGVAWSQRAMASRPDRTGVLAEFAGPVLLLRGEADEASSEADLAHMAEASPDARVVTVPAAGHLTANENPAAVATALAELVGLAKERAEA